MAIVYFAENINRVAGEACTLTLTLTLTLTNPYPYPYPYPYPSPKRYIRRQLGDSPQP